MKKTHLKVLFIFSIFLANSTFARTCNEVQKDLFQVASDVNTSNYNGVAAIQGYLSQAQTIQSNIQQSLSDVGNSSSSQFPGMVIHFRFNSILNNYLNPMIQDLSSYSVRFLQNRQLAVNNLNMLAAELSNCTH